VYPARPVGPSAVDQPLFSVIIPTYGRSRWLAEALESVLAQSVQDFEVIVVDDASPEPAQVADDPRVRLVRREENGGPAAARNTGVSSARGRYVTFLDDDDLYEPDRLELGLQGVRGGPLSVCWLGPLGERIGRKRWRQYRRNENRILNGKVDDVILDGLPPHVGQITIERDSFLPFDARLILTEDIEWWIRASLAMPVVTVPRIGYRLRKHAAPRLTEGYRTRVDTNLLVLTEHAAYFAARPKAAARRWRLQGVFALRMGDRSLARRALHTSLRLRRSPRTLAVLARTYRPGGR